MVGIAFWEYLFDPVLRAPTVGGMLMGLATSLVGVLTVLRKRSLLGEALSHAAFPGAVAGVVLASSLVSSDSEVLRTVLMVSAFISSCLGMQLIHYLETRLHVTSDAALCFTLAIFFGIGVLIASRVQVTHTIYYKQALVFLYGQAATLTDAYLYPYGILAGAILCTIWMLYGPLQAGLFDRGFAQASGIRVRILENILLFLMALAVVLGMRSVGVVLMSGMLVAPAIAARAWAVQLWSILAIAGLIGMGAAWMGNWLSVELSHILALRYPAWKFSLPTGPLILLCAVAVSVVSVLFAPRGFLARSLRMTAFRMKVGSENILKTMWKHGGDVPITIEEITAKVLRTRWSVCLLVWLLQIRGWVKKMPGGERYTLSVCGDIKAARIIRLHRLWEVYLVHHLRQGVERVHRSAEDLEHLADAQLEEELETLCGRLRFDPHSQPIPPREGS